MHGSLNDLKAALRFERVDHGGEPTVTARAFTSVEIIAGNGDMMDKGDAKGRGLVSQSL